jgi:hypothetical protein
VDNIKTLDSTKRRRRNSTQRNRRNNNSTGKGSSRNRTNRSSRQIRIRISRTLFFTCCTSFLMNHFRKPGGGGAGTVAAGGACGVCLATLCCCCALDGQYTGYLVFANIQSLSDFRTTGVSLLLLLGLMYRVSIVASLNFSVVWMDLFYLILRGLA